MTLRGYLWSVGIATLLAFGVLVLVLMFIHPYESGVSGLLFFYGSVFLFLTGIGILLLSWIHLFFQGEEATYAYNGVNFRQAIWFACLSLVLLYLQSESWLVWWVGLLVLAGFFLLELFFLLERDLRKQ